MEYDSATDLEMFNNYDEQLGASNNPDPNLLAILLMLSKCMHSNEIEQLLSWSLLHSVPRQYIIKENVIP